MNENFAGPGMVTNMAATQQGFPNPNMRPPINPPNFPGQFNRGRKGSRPQFGGQFKDTVRKFPGDRSGQQQFIDQRFQQQMQVGHGVGRHVPLAQVISSGQGQGQFQQAIPIQGQTQNIRVEAIHMQPNNLANPSGLPSNVIPRPSAAIPRPSVIPRPQPNGGNFPNVQVQGSNQNQAFFGNGRQKRHTDPDCQRLEDDPDKYCRTFETQCHNCTLEKRLRFEGM